MWILYICLGILGFCISYLILKSIVKNGVYEALVKASEDGLFSYALPEQPKIDIPSECSKCGAIGSVNAYGLCESCASKTPLK
ncbi:MAG: hypothetical protein E7487_04270 [Ruminococcaceae bacterium]|nr:hypothetical protein [Oscillospiraceae bacterium]